MVNLGAFGPVTNAKMSLFGNKSDKVKLIAASEVHDVEASNLLQVARGSRPRRRLRKCCWESWWCDVMGVASILAIVLVTGFLLYKLYFLKQDIEVIGSTMPKLSTEVSKLGQHAIELQKENRGLYALFRLYGAYVESNYIRRKSYMDANTSLDINGEEVIVQPIGWTDDDTPLEMADTSPMVLLQQKQEEMMLTHTDVQMSPSVLQMTISTSPVASIASNGTSLDLMGTTLESTDEAFDGDDSDENEFDVAEVDPFLDESDESKETSKPDKDDSDDLSNDDDGDSSEEENTNPERS